jgi:hypothetical protein
MMRSRPLVRVIDDRFRLESHRDRPGARGTASAALTLQSVILQALVYHGAFTPAQALEVVDKALEVSRDRAMSKAEKEVEAASIECLEGSV